MTGVEGATPSVRFRRVELDYGGHSGAFELGSAEKPFVIEGPNGSGKSTLVEALLRGLYGFRRRRSDDGAAYRRRRPWHAEDYRAYVTVETALGHWCIQRDFETDSVTIVSNADQPLFEGDANPTGTGESALRYRALLREAIGLDDLDDYLRTACVFQGGLTATRLNRDLLQVVAGGHVDVRTAKERLKAEYRKLTLAPIAGGRRTRRTPGQVETLEQQEANLLEQQRAALLAEKKRGPLVRQRDEKRTEIANLKDDLERLNDAYPRIAEVERQQQDLKTSRSRLRRAEQARRDLAGARDQFELAREQIARVPGPVLPADFLERASALEVLLPRMAHLERDLERQCDHERELVGELEREPLGPVQSSDGDSRRSVVTLSWLGLLVMISLVVLLVAGLVWAVGVAGATGVALWVLWRHRDAERREIADREQAARQEHQERWNRLQLQRETVKQCEGDLAELRDEIDERLKGVPETLSVEAIDRHRDQFFGQQSARESVEDKERTLVARIDQSERALSEGRDQEGRNDPSAGNPASRRQTDVRESARRLLMLLDDATSAERNNQAEIRLGLNAREDEANRFRLLLPADVEPSIEAVRGAVGERSQRLEEAHAELIVVERDLVSEARPEASALYLARALEDIRHDLEDCRDRALAYRHAFRLIGDAYEAFRRTDEERLLDAVGIHLRAVFGANLGPIEVKDGLEDAKVQMHGRTVPLETPPLSYGELHGVLLSIRMGATDFLAGLGISVPLLIDDPFVHLDEQRAGGLWEILCAVARNRQVIVATQDRLVLQHLGVESDLVLP